MTRKKNDVGQTEWSHFIDAEKIGSNPLKLTISPGPEERKRLAKRLALVELKSLESDLVMSRDNGGNVIFISGQIRADVTQSSVVTAKPIHNQVIDSFEAWFADPDQALSFVKAKQEKMTRDGQGDLPVLDESEDPEPIIDGKIDVAELVAQYFSLALDPYPRAEGEEFELTEDVKKKGLEAATEAYDNPFAALKDWKTRQETGES